MNTRGIWPAVPLEQYPDGTYPIICKDGITNYPAFVDKELGDRIFQFSGNQEELPDGNYVVINCLGKFHILNQYHIGAAFAEPEYQNWLRDLQEKVAEATRLTGGV